MLPHSTLVNPLVEVPPRHLGERKIRQIHLHNAPSFANAWESLTGFIQSRCAADECPVIVAHDANVVVSFLRRELHLSGKQFPDWDFVCSLKAAENILTKKPTQLGDVARELQLEHFARDSASARVKLLCKILDGMNRHRNGNGRKTLKRGNSSKMDVLEGAKSFHEFGEFDHNEAQPSPSQRYVPRPTLQLATEAARSIM